MRRLPAVLALLVPSAALTGCSAPEAERTAVAAVAVRFAGHTAGAGRAAACGLLAPATREALARDPGPSCEAGLRDAALPAPGRIRTTDVYGHQARVVLERDTYFATRFPGGWKIRAAGCAPRPDRPYDCRVKGD
ncbi:MULTISPECIES: hypothetical protein [Streptomyces]|uniref:Lipoprotein n=1 Tax=Streptomyces sudanensis TaxID=436397 RepID=A0ABY4T6V6_9ACTN|nr:MULTISPECIES: hypothetical protein [Streptomyces]MCP9956289.1 hypothetical protein [Streptomyces sudanensis]MCP9985502.1 hypothetical protein [Streptomyces sudanensis]MCQ0003084.1 hypothetical protein [Streptomyces sudanensis]URN14715.1 hypothetical protein MW084_00925 [Streptomyces sudanensis]